MAQTLLVGITSPPQYALGGLSLLVPQLSAPSHWINCMLRPLTVLSHCAYDVLWLRTWEVHVPTVRKLFAIIWMLSCGSA